MLLTTADCWVADWLSVEFIPWQVLASLRFEDFPTGSPQPDWFRELVRNRKSDWLRLLLDYICAVRLCTHGADFGVERCVLQVQVPPDGNSPDPNKRCITVTACRGDPRRLPCAHTCGNQLDLPLYDSEAVLIERVETALAHGSSGFGLG